MDGGAAKELSPVCTVTLAGGVSADTCANAEMAKVAIAYSAMLLSSFTSLALRLP
jgi:hypothetical protein